MSPTTSDPEQPITPPRPRRLLRFVKNEPGYRVSVAINMILLLNAVLFAIFGVMTILMPSGTEEEPYDLLDIIGIYFFCIWNSIVFTFIILFPSITTLHREKSLVFFYLNGLTVLFIRLSDFFRPLTKFQLFISILTHLFTYLLFMAVFALFYGLPEEFQQVSRTESMKPWRPVYEDDPEIPAEPNARGPQTIHVN